MDCLKLMMNGFRGNHFFILNEDTTKRLPTHTNCYWIDPITAINWWMPERLMTAPDTSRCECIAWNHCRALCVAAPSKTTHRLRHIKSNSITVYQNCLMFVSKYVLQINASKSGGGKYRHTPSTWIMRQTPRGFYGTNRSAIGRSTIKRLLIDLFDEIRLRFLR